MKYRLGGKDFSGGFVVRSLPEARSCPSPAGVRSNLLRNNISPSQFLAKRDESPLSITLSRLAALEFTILRLHFHPPILSCFCSAPTNFTV